MLVVFFPIGNYCLYTECLQSIVQAACKSSYSYLAISLYRFHMNTARLEGQPWPWFTLCWYLLLSNWGGVSPFPPLPTWSLTYKTNPFENPTPLILFIFFFYKKEDLIVRAKVCFFCNNSKKAGDGFSQCVLPSRAWFCHWHVAGFWYPSMPWTQEHCLQGAMLPGMQVVQLGPCNRAPCYRVVIVRSPNSTF